MRPILLTGLLLLTTALSFAQETDKTILLKNVTGINLPDAPYYACPTIACGDQVQVIATGLTQGEKTPLPAFITSRLGKGRLLILPSDRYFRKPLLDNPDIQQLMHNCLEWAGGQSVQVWGYGQDLAPWLRSQKVNDVITDSSALRLSAGVLILTEDVSDSFKRGAIEQFIRGGGTLIFGSTIADAMNQGKPDYYAVNLNDLLIKAGLYHVNVPLPVDDNQNRLQTGAAPPYMQITTLLAAAGDPHFSAKAYEAGAYASTLSNYLFHNDDTAATFGKILQLFGPSGQGPLIPTPEHPVSKWNTREYLRYTVQENLMSKQLNAHPDPGYVHPASETFPGAVDPAAKRVDQRITIPVQVGSQGLPEPGPGFFRLHSSGLYVAAGDKVRVTIDAGDLPLHLKAQIGVHDDELGHMENFFRNEHDLTRTFELDKVSTEIYSPFGGILMIKVPDTTSLKKIVVRVSGAVRAPYFKLGATSVRDWKRKIRDYPGPWAELASDKLILTVPSYRIRKLDDPEKLMRFWDEVMDADARLAAISTTRAHPERIIIDRQVAFGALFTSNRKIVGPDDDNCALILDEGQVRMKGSWGHFHELGHRHQFWGIDFDGVGEVTVNLYTMYVYDKVLHKGLYNHENISSRAAVIADIKRYMAGKPDFATFCNDPFLALSMYIEIIEAFGWRSIEQVFATYRKLPKDQYPATEADKRDYWFTCICAATGKDLSAFFDKWKVPVTDKAKESVRGLPGWLPEELK